MTEKKEKARQLFEQGKTLKEIAETLDISYNTIKYWKKQGFTIGEGKATEQQPKKKPKEKQKLISDMEDRFCVYYAETLNIYSSAINAGFSESYARNSIYQLMKKPIIKAYIEKLKENIHEAKQMTKEDLLALHHDIIYARDITTVFDENGEVKTGFKNIKAVELIEEKKGKDILRKKRVEFVDPTNSINFMNKHLGIDPAFRHAEERIQIAKIKAEVPTQGQDDKQDMTIEEYIQNYYKK